MAERARCSSVAPRCTALSASFACPSCVGVYHGWVGRMSPVNNSAARRSGSQSAHADMHVYSLRPPTNQP